MAKLITISVFQIRDIRELRYDPNLKKRWCEGVAYTNSGKQSVGYTIEWADEKARTVWLQTMPLFDLNRPESPEQKAPNTQAIGNVRPSFDCLKAKTAAARKLCEEFASFGISREVLQKIRSAQLLLPSEGFSSSQSTVPPPAPLDGALAQSKKDRAIEILRDCLALAKNGSYSSFDGGLSALRLLGDCKVGWDAFDRACKSAPQQLADELGDTCGVQAAVLAQVAIQVVGK